MNEKRKLKDFTLSLSFLICFLMAALAIAIVAAIPATALDSKLVYGNF